MENINYRHLDVWAIYRDPEHVFDALNSCAMSSPWTSNSPAL